MKDNKESEKTILILSANPKGTEPLRLDEEVREIEEGLQRAGKRELFSIRTRKAVRYQDIRRAILDYKPHIIHFCGHGTGEEGLAFEDERGEVKLVETKAIANLFKLFADEVECVILNACYSIYQAREIAKHINYVVGMSQNIGDKAAIEFAVGFYDALGAGRGYEFAYKLGCNSIETAGIKEELTPQFLEKNNPRLISYDNHARQRLNNEHPTVEAPLLVGILVDVSASMFYSANNLSNEKQNRFQDFQKAFDNLIATAEKKIQEKVDGRIEPLVKIFALGFGFNNPIAIMLGDKGESVRNLLSLKDTSSLTVGIDKLIQNKKLHENNIEDLAFSMFGDTPMREAFQEAEKILEKELKQYPYSKPPILFVISDGMPSDAKSSVIIEIAERLKNKGVLIISCYITNQDVTKPRHLYQATDEDWEDGAKLMFNCASKIPLGSPYLSHFFEFKWEIEEDAHLFTQINQSEQSEMLSEFIESVISSLTNQS